MNYRKNTMIALKIGLRIGLRVVLLGSNSKWTKVMSGDPQGSVLGPHLFLIYIHDLGDSVYSRVLKFADDTNLVSVVSNANDIKLIFKFI